MQKQTKQTDMKTILSLAALLACLASCTIGGGEDDEYGKGLLETGTTAPDFTVYTDEYPDGTTLSSLRGGYVLIEFWASWCPDCQKATPVIKDINDTFAPKGLTLLGVSFDEDAAQWQAYIADNGLDWMQHRETLPWSESPVAATYNVRWIPTLYLIDPEGRVDFATVNAEEMADTIAARPLAEPL